jgi:hypothetical protein
VQRFHREVKLELSKNEKKFIDENKLIDDLHEIVKLTENNFEMKT